MVATVVALYLQQQIVFVVPIAKLRKQFSMCRASEQREVLALKKNYAFLVLVGDFGYSLFFVFCDGRL